MSGPPFCELFSRPHQQLNHQIARMVSRRDLIAGLPAVASVLGCWGTSVAAAVRVGPLSSIDPTAAAGGSALAPRATAKNCIVIWLDGGPSHLETWDLKPQAPREVRGPLEAISTSIAGLQISECFAETASRMQHLAIIRSMTSPLGEHNLGTHYLLTGYAPTPVLDYPTIAAVGTYVRQNTHGSDGRSKAGTLPENVAIPDFSVGGARLNPSGYLPSGVAPFAVRGDPASASFQVRNLHVKETLDVQRLQRRQRFFQQMKTLENTATVDTAVSGTPSAFEQAFRMLVTADAREAFDLSAEPAAVRQRYGPKTVGQSCLLARRLVERGVPFITVNVRGWDTHASLYTQLKEGFTGAKQPVGLIPSLDLALSALLDDLSDRGLLQETLVVVMGEFGRTPKLNAAGGRDHWPRAFSVALAGGGVTGGQVIGASDRTGESPAERPVTPADLVCSIYSLLGIDPQTEFMTADGRPVRLSPEDAQPIAELWS